MCTVPFGRRDVSKVDKPDLVRQVFSGVADRYDLMNDLMSCGVHRFWRRVLIATIAPSATGHLLDIAGGTGDIALRYLRAGGGRATVVDPTPEMTDVGRRRADDSGFAEDRLIFVNAPAEHLPFDENLTPLATMSFGLRNVTDIAQSLSEVLRVLTPGGRFYCLEFSRPSDPRIANWVQGYNHRVLPLMGRFVVGDDEPYKYLAESIDRFLGPVELCHLMDEAGFVGTRYRCFAGGAVAMHSGVKS